MLIIFVMKPNLRIWENLIVSYNILLFIELIYRIRQGAFENIATH